MALKGQAKKNYQRDYMRKRRRSNSGSNAGSNKEGKLTELRKLITHPEMKLSGSFHPYPKPNKK